MHHQPSRRAARGLLLLLLALVLSVTTLGQVPSSARPAPPSSPSVDPGDKIANPLQNRFEANSAEPRDFWISFDASADTSAATDIDDWADRGRYVMDRLRQSARAAQADAVETLDAAGADYTSYWVTNAIRVHGGDYSLAMSLAASDEVDRIFAPVTYQQDDPVEQKLTGRMRANAAGPEWGVRDIKADQVWQKYGVRGDGVVVASIDTGAELDHPALVSHYRGTNPDGTFTNDYNWLDTSGASAFPTDQHGHGTHTMGTMVGDDGGSNQTGVAPGATWIEANGCCASDETLLAASQWMLAPTKTDGSAPDPAKRPNVVNSSWGSEVPTNEPFLEDIQQAWADSGIFGVWSNGNNGPSCNTAGSPGSRTLNYAVGAIAEDDTIASFSSRGPGQDGEVKPNIAAPGDNVRSSYLDGQYAAMSGTSMAAPHVSGAVALLLSAHPELIGDIPRIRQLLDDTAVDTPDDQCGGTADDNDVYGEGRLDALALVEAVDSGQSGAIGGTVTDGSGNPVTDAAITLSGDAGRRSTRTGADGGYAVANIPVGTYRATVTAFGFEPGRATIEVTAGHTTTTDVALEATKGFTVSGSISDRNTGRPIEGTATVMGTRYAATADAAGEFTIKNVPGPRSYTIRIDDGGRCATPVYRSINVTGDGTIAPVELRRRTDQPLTQNGWWGGPYGYSCLLERTQWIRGNHQIQKPASYDSVPLRLPFTFTYFGKDYTTAFASPSTIAQVGFWTTPYNTAEYPYDEYGQDAINYGLAPRLGGAFDDGRAQMLTRTTGQAPNRAFTIEFRDYRIIGTDSRFSYEVTLHEDGDIVFAYNGIDPDDLDERGQRTIVEINDHSPDGRAGLRTSFEYSNWEPVLESGRQIRFSLPDNGFVDGTVVDKRTGDPVEGASVDLVDAHGWLTQRMFTNASGEYRFQLMAGKPYTVSVLKEPGYAAVRSVPVKVQTDRQTVALRTALSGGRMVTPGGVTATRGKSATVTLRNTGSAKLQWRATAAIPTGSSAKPGTEVSTTRYGQAALGVEEVDGQYWIGDLVAHRVVEVTESGDPTGRTIGLAAVAEALGVTDDPSFTPSDMAWVPAQGMLCMTFYNFSNDIACVDPDDPGDARHMAVVRTGFRSELAVQGLAYDADGDRFFAIAGMRTGGWQHQLRSIAGLAHSDTGQVLSTCTYARQGQGLGWNPQSQTIWTHTQDITLIGLGLNQSIYRQLDPETCAEESSVTVPKYSVGGMPGTSLDLDEHGDLVTTFFATGTIATVKTSDPITRQPRWISLPTDSGALKVNKSATIPVQIDWAAVPEGVDSVDLVLRGNGSFQPTRVVPITLRR